MQTGERRRVTLKQATRLRLSIDSLIFGGEGLARYKSFVVFVPFTVPGDKIIAEIEEVKKNFARARLVEIISSSEHRINPICPYFFKIQDESSTKQKNEQIQNVYLYCGGCSLQHVDYPAQLSQKTHLVKESAIYIGKLKDVIVHDIIGAKNAFSYRNKIQQAVTTKLKEGKKELISGFYTPDSHNLLDIKNCYLQPTIANEIISLTKDIFNEYGLNGYEEELHRGLIRHIVVRQSLLTREVMLIIVTRDKELPNIPEIVERLTAGFPQIKSIVHNINNKKTNKILGDYSKVIFGKDTINEKIGHLNFKISASSFFQVNTQQAEELYKTIENFLLSSFKDKSKISTIIDVFSGTGAIALWISRLADKVYGIEVNEEAVRNAIDNAELNNITNCEFRLGDAELILRRMQKNRLQPDVIILDPPRKGCSRKLLDTIKVLRPNDIIYVSCEPTTLARDLHYFDKLKYKTIQIQPIDMFPQTSHIECVARLKRKK